MTDIEGRHISKYQADRLAEGASPRTVNLEIGSLRNILKRHGVWARIQPSVRMLPAAESAGKALTSEEERKLLDACAKSRSRSLSPFVTLALESGARFGTLKDLHWSQIDFAVQSITLGHDKTRWGSYRTIPLSARALAILEAWAAEFPDREPQDFVFPSERYGGGGKKDRFGFETGTSVAYSIDRGKPMGTFKTAWNAARKLAGLSVRFHDLRHSAATRMFAAGTPLPVVARILGWSPSQAVLMSARYSHFSLEALRSAVERISGAGSREVQTGSPGLSPGLAASKVFTIH